MASKKIPEAIFTCKADNGKALWSNPNHWSMYLQEHQGEHLFIHAEPIAQIPEKMRMYAYYHTGVMACAVVGFTAAGYEGIDEVAADYLLLKMFAKKFVKNTKTGQYEEIVLGKSGMTKARLNKFINDCIFFIETELGITVPSGDDYLLNKKTGRSFQSVKPFEK